MEQDETSQAHYQIFLFCIWQEKSFLPNDELLWRFSLENPRTTKRIGFKSLEEFVLYLRRLVSLESSIVNAQSGINHENLHSNNQL